MTRRHLLATAASAAMAQTAPAFEVGACYFRRAAARNNRRGISVALSRPEEEIRRRIRQ